jgi:hypothetical protein
MTEHERAVFRAFSKGYWLGVVAASLTHMIKSRARW